MLRAGIVGLPNVGKSTLFNAVTRTRKAAAENYPFCTIDPNLGIVTVPDARLEPLARIVKTPTIIPAAIEFVDIAGLVKGASQGEGLGNKFLSHVREVDAMVQVVRCFEDPDICTTNYGNFAEMDLATGVLNGLAPGTSAGDQNMIQAEAGPVGDLRMAIRPALDDGTPGFGHQYLNLAITGQPFGPSTQPNARLAICMTYYDNPALAGRSFRPEVYQSDRNGTTTFAFTPANIAVVLQGTDRWREAYFELPDVKFLGVNQGPQAAARFAVNGKIFFSRVRYAVIRPCGPYAGVNPLVDCKPVFLGVAPATNGNGMLRLTWPAESTNFVLESTPTLLPTQWRTVTNPAPTVEGSTKVVTITNTGTDAYYRLRSTP